jgi:hypothetical protein
MAKLKDLFAHRKDFKPSAPTSTSDKCKCPECGHEAPFSEWEHHDGMSSGFYCEDCNDFHSCFECPGCGEFIGAAGSYSGQIEVDAAEHVHRAPSESSETTAPPDDTEPRQNHVRDAVRANR